MRLSSLFLLLVSLLPLTALAEIKDSDEWIVKRREHRMLTNLNDAFGLPDTPLADNVTVAVVDINFVSCDILIVGSIQADAKKYGRILDEWQQAQNLNQTVYYSQEDDCAAARLQWANSQFGASSGSISVDLPSLLAALNTAEKTVHPVLRIGKGTTADPGRPADYTSPNSQRYWLLKNNPTPLKSIYSSVSIPSYMPALLIVWFTLPLAGILFGFVAGRLIVKNKPISSLKKSQLFNKIALGSTFGSIGIHVVLVMSTLFNGSLNPVSYLWFGTRFTSAALLPIMVGPIIAVAALPLLNKLEKNAVEATANTPQEQAALDQANTFKKQIEEETLTELKAFRRKWLPLMLTLAVVGLTIGIGGSMLPKTHPLRPFAPFGMVLISVGVTFPAFVQTRQKRTTKPLEDNNTITQIKYEIAPIAEKLGIPIPPIRMASTKLFPTHALQKNGKAIEVGDRFLESIPYPERNFVYAVELAKFKHPEVPLLALILPLTLIANTPIAYMLFVLPSGSPDRAKFLPIAIGFILVVMFGFAALTRFYRNRTTSKRDILAASLVGKQTAISALKHMALPFPELKLSQTTFESAVDHPEFGKRIEALKHLPD